jgi:hypothetical protein
MMPKAFKMPSDNCVIEAACRGRDANGDYVFSKTRAVNIRVIRQEGFWIPNDCHFLVADMCNAQGENSKMGYCAYVRAT